MSMSVNPFLFGTPGGGGDCNPADFSGATGFFDGTSASLPGLADLGAVGSSTNWIDQITGTRNWSQGTGADRPILHTTGGPNGQPYLQFTDNTDSLTFSNSISSLLTVGAYTIFVVIRPQRDGVNDNAWTCPQIIGTFNQFWGIAIRNTGSGNKFSLWQDRSSPAPRTDSVESTTTYSQNVWYIVECWWNGTNMNIKVNNDTTVSKAYNNIASLGNTPTIGGDLTSDIAGIYTWNADIGSTNRDSFRSCLGIRFGITLP